MIGPLEELVSALSRLPGIGRRSAERIAFFLMQRPDEAANLSQAIGTLHRRVKRCPRCFNYSEGGLCPICRDPKREKATICVVAYPWEVERIERSGAYRGLYHVLGGLLSPDQDRSPGELTIHQLLERVRREGIQEVILALEPKVEGEFTAMFLSQKLKPLGVKVTRIAQGVPVGRDLEAMDEITLGKAIQGRFPM